MKQSQVQNDLEAFWFGPICEPAQHSQNMTADDHRWCKYAYVCLSFIFYDFACEIAKIHWKLLHIKCSNVTSANNKSHVCEIKLNSSNKFNVKHTHTHHCIVRS